MGMQTLLAYETEWEKKKKKNDHSQFFHRKPASCVWAAASPSPRSSFYKHAQEKVESQITDCQGELNKVQEPQYFKCGAQL